MQLVRIQFSRVNNLLEETLSWGPDVKPTSLWATFLIKMLTAITSHHPEEVAFTCQTFGVRAFTLCGKLDKSSSLWGMGPSGPGEVRLGGVF